MYAFSSERNPSIGSWISRCKPKKLTCLPKKGDMDHLPSTIFQRPFVSVRGSNTVIPHVDDLQPQTNSPYHRSVLVHLRYRVALNTSLVRQTFCITPKWNSMMCNTTSDLCSTNFSYKPQVVQSISSTTTFRYNKSFLGDM